MSVYVLSLATPPSPCCPVEEAGLQRVLRKIVSEPDSLPWAHLIDQRLTPPRGPCQGHTQQGGAEQDSHPGPDSQLLLPPPPPMTGRGKWGWAGLTCPLGNAHWDDQAGMCRPGGKSQTGPERKPLRRGWRGTNSVPGGGRPRGLRVFFQFSPMTQRGQGPARSGG